MEPILSDQDRTEVAKILSGVTGEVQVDLYTKRSSPSLTGEIACASCPDTEQLLTEVAALNEKIKLTVHDAAVDPEPARKAGLEGIVPALTFRSAATKGTLRYLGLPSGYEFRTLLDVLIAAGSGDSGLSEESKGQLSKVSRQVKLQVFVTPG